MQDENQQKLVAELGIEAFPPAEQEKLLVQFGEVALKAATIAVLEKMSEAKREEFAQVAQTGDDAKVKAFLDAEVPNHEQVAGQAVAAEIQNFKLALGGVQAA